MFDWLWKGLGRIKRTILIFLGWCRDPWAGGRMTRPLTREFTSTGESLVYIFAHRTGSALYSVFYVLIFDGLATVVRFIIGVLSDIVHSDYKYGRYIGGLLLSFILMVLNGLAKTLQWSFEQLKKLFSRRK